MRAVVTYLGQLVERIEQAEAQLAEVEAQLAKQGGVRDDNTLAPRRARSRAIEMMPPGV